MKVFITGAAGELGSWACRFLAEEGHELVCTDVRFAPSFPFELHVEDLTDPLSVYRLAKGCDAVVHLANHRHVNAIPLAQKLFAENLAMNANVFRASFELGAKRFIFASSVQVMFGFDRRMGDPSPLPIPYFPMNAAIGRRPQNNYYALSKEVGERMLENLAHCHPDIACTALRFPLLLQPDRDRNLHAFPQLRAEGLAHLTFSDGGRLIARAIAQQKPGYHEYFPAQAAQVEGHTVEEALKRYFGGIEIRRPIGAYSDVIDSNALERDLGWKPVDTPFVVTL